jgi:hypothetical protein
LWRAITMNATSPSLEEFLVQAEMAFRFLEDEYGCVKQSSAASLHPNPFSVRYENALTAVVVEGVNWGSAAIVSVGKKGGRPGNIHELVPLWTLARLEAEGKENALTVAGQFAQLQASAAALQRLAGPALQGDFAAIEAARAYLEEHVPKASTP